MVHAAWLMVSIASLLGCQPVQTPRTVLESNFDTRNHRWANMSPLGPESESEWSAAAGRTGGGIHMKGWNGAPDQQRMWKHLLHEPPTGRTLRVSAWARGRGVEHVVSLVARAAAPADALFDVASSTQVDQPLKGDFDWTKLSTTIDVPRRSANVQVMLMLVGNGEVWFDDVLVEDIGEAALIEPGVYELRIECTATSETVNLPLPEATRTQQPIEALLRVEPPERLRSAHLARAASGEYGVAVTLAPGGSSARVVLSTMVLASDGRPLALPERAAVPARWPDEAIPFLDTGAASTAGSDAMAAITRCIVESAGSPLEHAAPRLVTRLRSAGLPARVIQVIAAWRTDGRPYGLAEVYVPEQGWTLIEPGLGRLGWPRHAQWEVSAFSAPALRDAAQFWRPVRNIPADTAPRTWDDMRRAASERWKKWLETHPDVTASGTTGDWRDPTVDVLKQLLQR